MYQECIENFWGKKALHIPNVNDLFGYQTKFALPDYSNRIIAALPVDHGIVLPKCSEQPLIAMYSYFRNINLSVIDINKITFVDANDGGSLIKKAKNHLDRQSNIIPYIRSEAFYALCQQTNKLNKTSYEIIRRLNNKCCFRKILAKYGIQTPLSFYVDKNDKEVLSQCLNIIKKIENEGYQEFVVSLAESYQGFGTYRFKTIAELIDILDSIGDQEFLISPWYNDIVEQPSFQVYIGEKPEDDMFLGLTDQIVSGAAHVGNIFPSSFSDNKAVQEVIYKTIELLRKEGVFGPVGVDLFIRSVNGEKVIYVVEANVRQTAAFYPKLISFKLFGDNDKAWKTRTYSINEQFSLDEFLNLLKEKDIDYRYGDENGVFITHLSLSAMKVTVIIFGDSREALNEIEQQLNKIQCNGINRKKVGLWVYRNEGGDVAQIGLKRKLESYGFQVINNFDLREAYYKNGSVFTKDGFNLSTLDVLYHMNLDEKTKHVDDILKAIEYSGVPVINDMSSHFLAADKFLTNVALRKAGVPVPDAVMVNVNSNYETLKQLLNEWQGIVVKPRFSRGGDGIVKIQSVEDLNDLMGILKQNADNVYLERYVPFGDHDYRVELMNGEVIGCYSRKKKHGFKTNLHTGGTVVYLDNYQEAIKIAKKAAEAIGVKTTIVDIVKNTVTDEYVVIEVNEIMGIFLENVIDCPNHSGVNHIPKECQYKDKKINLLVDYINKNYSSENE